MGEAPMPQWPVIRPFPRIPRENPDNFARSADRVVPRFSPGAPPMIQTPMRNLSLAAVALFVFASALAAATTPEPPTPLGGLQGRPDVIGEEMLGGTFQNPLAGIAFRTPVNCVQVKAT